MLAYGASSAVVSDSSAIILTKIIIENYMSMLSTAIVANLSKAIMAALRKKSNFIYY